jgi:hypothetical protein
MHNCTPAAELHDILVVFVKLEAGEQHIRQKSLYNIVIFVPRKHKCAPLFPNSWHVKDAETSTFVTSHFIVGLGN